MSLTVNFGTTNDPVHCVNKTYTLIKQVVGTPIEAENVLNPTFLLDYYSNLLDCNYCEITDWNRFYYCKVVLENGGNLRVMCNTDTLKTFWDTIKIQPVTIVRSSSFERPTYVQDGMLPVDQSRTLPPKVIYFDTIHNDTHGNADCYDVLNTI